MTQDRERPFPHLDESTFEKYERLAPGWQIRCKKCGKREHLGKFGIRRGAVSAGKCKLGWCSRCGRVRCLRVSKFR
ncbi:hypothetical protein [Poriferisphaera sp. WC338]|uniref:hypothetical protein n=1 Tax=Poriferisphaera sp. WC338 TaxID=3425129 RepID=UPI003D81A4DF